MSKIEKPWCPCQEERFSEYPEEDLPYVVDYLVEVKNHTYWKQKRKEARKQASDFSYGPGPKTPRTRRGTKVINENFPEADLVCPCCEQEYVEEIERTVKEV